MLKRFIPTATKSIRKFHASSKNSARILCTDGVDELCVKIFKERGHQVDLLKTMSEEQLCKVIGEYEGLVVRSATKVTPLVLKHSTKMRVIGRAGVGVDNINVKEATKFGVLVMNTPDGNTISTAQLAMSLLTSMARSIPAANMSVKEGKWDRKSFTGVELFGKTLGIVGCGRIGQVVASCAKAMGMRVIGFDPVMSKEAMATTGIARAEKIEQIWKESDFITLHTPLTPETSNLLNDTTLALCKKGVRIVNCARGGIVEEQALLRALNTGHVAGAALDVFTSEPPKEHLAALLSHPNLVCTPHLGASTEEAQVNVARDIAKQMCDLLDGKDYVGVVNVPYIAAASLPNIKPFMRLAESMGGMLAQMSESPVEEMTLRTWGGRDVNITAPQTRMLLEAKVLKGLVLHRGLDLVPDLVSSPAMAKEVGIISSISSAAPSIVGRDTPYWNAVSVDVRRKDGSTNTMSGVVLGSDPYIVQVDEFDTALAFKPERGQILTFRNEDRPGAIATVLEALATSSINVASFNISRQEKSGKALCFMGLDDPVPTTVLNALKRDTLLANVASIHLR